MLEAAAAGLAIDRLAVYEVPYMIGEEVVRRWREYVAQLEALLAEGRRGDAVAAFMRLAGASEQNIAAARESPLWPGLEAIAHTLAHDAACLGDGRPPTARLAGITRPALVVSGRACRPIIFAQAADALAAALPHAERLILEGQTHVVDPRALAPELVRCFGA